MTEVTDERTLAVYQKFLVDEKDDTIDFQQNINGQVQPSGDMGYISSVQQARELFERLYNTKKES